MFSFVFLLLLFVKVVLSVLFSCLMLLFWWCFNGLRCWRIGLVGCWLSVCFWWW